MSGAQLDPGALLALRPPPVGQGAPPGRSDLPGMFRSARRGIGHDVADLRAYVPGDDLRHIDPSATARTGELHVRAFHQDTDRALVLIADFRAPMLWGVRRALRSVAAAEALVIAGWQALDRGEKLGLAVIRDGAVEGLSPAARPDTMARVVGVLCDQHRAALAGTETVRDLSDGLERAARGLPRHGRLLLATGGEQPGDVRVLRRLADRHAVQVLRVGTGLERGAAAGRYPVLGQGGDWTGAAMAPPAPLAAGVAERWLDPAQAPQAFGGAPWPMTA